MNVLITSVGSRNYSGSHNRRRRGQRLLPPRRRRAWQRSRWPAGVEIACFSHPRFLPIPPPPKPATHQLYSYRAKTTHGSWLTIPHTLYVLFRAICAQHHASRASRSTIVRAFVGTYIITGDHITTSEPRERSVRLLLMLSDCPVRTLSLRIAYHHRQQIGRAHV